MVTVRRWWTCEAQEPCLLRCSSNLAVSPQLTDSAPQALIPSPSPEPLCSCSVLRLSTAAVCVRSADLATSLCFLCLWLLLCYKIRAEYVWEICADPWSRPVALTWAAGVGKRHFRQRQVGRKDQTVFTSCIITPASPHPRHCHHHPNHPSQVAVCPPPPEALLKVWPCLFSCSIITASFVW